MGEVRGNFSHRDMQAAARREVIAWRERGRFQDDLYFLLARRLHHEEFSLADAGVQALRRYWDRCRALKLDELVEERGEAILQAFCLFADILFARLAAICDRDGIEAAVAELVRGRNTLDERRPRQKPPHLTARHVAVRKLPPLAPVVVVQADDRERIRQARVYQSTAGPPR